MLHHADARRVDEHAVAFAAIDHLGVAGDELHARRFGRTASGSAPRAQSVSIGSPSSRMSPQLR